MIDFPTGLRDLSADAYHDIPALSASGAWTLVQQSPLHYWHDSPMNPDYAPEHKREFDIGTAAHLAILEPEKFVARTVVVDAPDWRTKDAKEKREDAYNRGLTPLLVHQLDQVKAIRAALLAHPIAAGAFVDGKPEQSFFWRDQETKIPCKGRADWVRGNGRYLADLKTHATANPREFPRAAYGLGYPLRAAWYLDGYEQATGTRPEEYWFVVVEREPPHAIAVFRYDERAIEWGRLLYREALATLARCIVKDECPGYRHPDYPDKDRAFTISLPSFAEYQLQERHEAGEFRAEKPSPALLAAAMKMQAPL